jgi:hypothetical protein
MKYFIEINLPLEKTFDLYTNRDKLKEWQKKIINHDVVRGVSGEVQSLSKLTCMGVDIFETIISKNRPFEITSEYEHKRNGATKMYHTAINEFSKIDENKTVLEMTVQQEVPGFIPRLIMKIFAGSVRKHHQKLINDFKLFTENKPIEANRF